MAISGPKPKARRFGEILSEQLSVEGADGRLLLELMARRKIRIAMLAGDVDGDGKEKLPGSTYRDALTAMAQIEERLDGRVPVAVRIGQQDDQESMGDLRIEVVPCVPYAEPVGSGATPAAIAASNGNGNGHVDHLPDDDSVVPE